MFSDVFDYPQGGSLYDVTFCLWTETPPGYGKERAVRILLECILVTRFDVRRNLSSFIF